MDQLDRRAEPFFQISDRRRPVRVFRQLDVGVKLYVRTAVGLSIVRVPRQLRHTTRSHWRVHKVRKFCLFCFFFNVRVRCLDVLKSNWFLFPPAQTLRSRITKPARPVFVRTVEVSGNDSETIGMHHRQGLSGTYCRPCNCGTRKQKSKLIIIRFYQPLVLFCTVSLHRVRFGFRKCNRYGTR